MLLLFRKKLTNKLLVFFIYNKLVRYHCDYFLKNNVIMNTYVSMKGVDLLGFQKIAKKITKLRKYSLNHSY